jgi:hypothetical protein
MQLHYEQDGYDGAVISLIINNIQGLLPLRSWLSLIIKQLTCLNQNLQTSKFEWIFMCISYLATVEMRIIRFLWSVRHASRLYLIRAFFSTRAQNERVMGSSVCLSICFICISASCCIEVSFLLFKYTVNNATMIFTYVYLICNMFRPHMAVIRQTFN